MSIQIKVLLEFSSPLAHRCKPLRAGQGNEGSTVGSLDAPISPLYSRETSSMYLIFLSTMMLRMWDLTKSGYTRKLCTVLRRRQMLGSSEV